MITSKANRDKPFVLRKVLRLAPDRLYFFRSSEAPKTGYWKRNEKGEFSIMMTGMKYSFILVF